MTLITETRIETPNASQYLDELCRQLDERSHAKPELGVHVEWTDTAGTVDFGWGRCSMRADNTVLQLQAEAPDQNGLEQVRELITRHIEKLARDSELPVTWHQDGAPMSEDGHVARRDAMRGFHRRMRH